MNRNLCKLVLSKGGKLVPLIIPNVETNGTGLMNPSIYLDDDKLILNLRHVNYTLYHCENEQLFNNRFGPLAYLNPENDMHLRTTNFFCVLDNNNLSIKEYCRVDTSLLDKEPIWEFVGLEDARIVRWDNKLYMCGVRRDTTTNGQGRMELSEIIIDNGKVKEINRYRIEPPVNKDSYCEKNWMPVLDKPFHFIKWTNPSELVKVNINTLTSEIVYLSPNTIPNIPDFRGSSQVINYKDYRICLVHTVDLFTNKQKQKDGTYMHHFIVWDKDWNVVSISDPFSFMDGEIEFCCGMTLYKGDLLITFGFQDNAAYLLKVPSHLIDNIIGIKESDFEWGDINKNKWYYNIIKKDIFKNNIYEKFFEVEQNDIVLDIGSSVGPFVYSILKKCPKLIYCLEPNTDLFYTLVKNTQYQPVICINKGISNVDGKTEFNSLFSKDCINMLGVNGEGYGIRFDTLLKTYHINKIDFLKINCEGGEYEIFNSEYFNWIKQNVKKISCKCHLTSYDLKERFRIFRNEYLSNFDKVEVYSVDGVDIKWDLWNEHFLDYYKEVMIYIDNRSEYIIKGIKKWQVTDCPTLEITTSIPENGCVNDCIFCPQRLLSKSYTEQFNNNFDRIMSLDNFKKVIDKLPKEIRITFAGFTEPYLNKNCTDMIIYAYESGHQISLFTTGIGMTLNDIKRIKNIPFSSDSNGGFTLHIPDNEYYSKHPITNKYIKLLEYIRDIRDEITNFKIVCMGTVHDRIRHIFTDYDVTPQELWSRAGNLHIEESFKSELKEVKDKYKSVEFTNQETTCNCREKLYHNVLLPNGNVSLCCMDYGLKYIIGNLYNQEYEDVIPNMDDNFLICNLCENRILKNKN